MIKKTPRAARAAHPSPPRGGETARNAGGINLGGVGEGGGEKRMPPADPVARLRRAPRRRPRAPRLASAERLLATCTTLRARARGDDLYRRVAVERWGAAFWRRALTRRTSRHFLSMRHELRLIAQFERQLAAMDAPAWGEADYRLLWDCEERVIDAAATSPSRRSPVA